jgi:putative YphP/YqiW family bacilliredoxin
MRYDPVTIQPYRDELTKIGFRELTTVADVDRSIREEGGTNLLVVNSVCGCAAGKARPGVAMALKQAPYRPDHLTTVFAGGDIEATARAREHFGDIPPSSPSIALFRDGRLVHFVPRHEIQRRDASGIAQLLVEAFKEYCKPETAAAE